MNSARPYSKKIIAAWGGFDFASHSFSGIMTVFVFPIYFHKVIVTNGHGDAYWGVTVFLSMLLVALITPLLGAMADVLHNKKLYLAIFTAVTIVCTVLLYFMQPGMVLLAAALFILANAGFEGGIVFYDAFLPEITTPETFGRISGIGFAFGYLGSLAILILNIPFFETAPKTTFLVTAAFFTIFAIPMFFIVPENRKSFEPGFGKLVRRGFSQLRATVGHIRQYKDITRFLLAFFLYNDAVLTVIAFSGIYANVTLHFGMMELAAFFAMIQIIAVVGSILFGKFADKHGSKRAIVISLFIWIAVVIGAYFTTTKTGFYFVGGVAGMALGSSQSCSRSLMALLTPPEHTAEFFGFYDGFCGKASAVIGPILFGVLSDVFGSERPAIVALAIFFIAGLILLRRVDEKRAVRAEEQLEMQTI
ncbi:MAG TPA: MFS transporter [Candidatus Kapabacteria bacterium]|nr:MFS transporter [Candidatus Kapabacteria bacterium]